MLDKLFHRYGTFVSIYHKGNRIDVQAIFMPTTSRSWQNMEHVYTPLGETPRGQYNYIGPVGALAQAGDLLIVGDRRYFMRRSEEIRDSHGMIYRWGLCVEEGGIDSWGRDP